MKKAIIGLSVVIIIALPFIWRFFEPKTVMDIAILDVGSMDDRLLEREGITTALNIEKVVNDQQQAYKASEDYFGVSVSPHKEDIVFSDFPARYDTYDMIYLSNTYGIRESDLAWGNEDSSHILYGGLSNSAWRNIKSRLKQANPVTLVVEQNSLNNHTADKVQKELEEVLGIAYSNWQGKQFADLADWDASLSGSGLVFRNEVLDEVIVLETDAEVTLATTEQGAEIFGFSASEGYTEWFDVSQGEQGQALAHFQLDLEPTQWEELEAKGIGKELVAVNYHPYEGNHVYYLAGNFSYKKQESKLPFFKGYVALQKLISEDRFYWHTYYPMMQAMLHTAQHANSVAEVPISVDPVEIDGLSYNARVLENGYEVLLDGKWQPLTIKGVNIGMARPGTFPGEAAISKEEYARWFNYIAEMNANTIRVYTLHPPGFYEALKEHNETHEKPLYVFHGVWVDEGPVEETLDIYGEPTERFQSEIKNIVDVIHGNATIEQKPGHAYGTYTADISPYVIGWMLGIEWYPFAVEGTNNKHATKAQHNGQFFSTKGASPFEIWLAEQFEFTAQYEAESYNWIRPFSFTNWVTTDLLDHPYEPNAGEEDYISVNPNVIYVKNQSEAVGQFASYHVYPYYPDFLNYTPEYVNYTDHRGEKNNYAAYLKDLHAAHRLPVLISEFGIPSSRGLTHENPFGWNQGFIAEDEQGKILAHLYEDIIHEGMLGGIAFTWQDEWFKRTWNTMDLDNPDQRPYWSNAQTNEQQFGILSFDTLKRKVDGDTSDWFGVKPFYEGDDVLEKVFVDSDERYLYIRFDMKDPLFTANRYPVIYMDTVADQGNTKYEGIPLPVAADFILELKGDDNSRVKVDAYYDIYQKIYGDQLQLVPFTGTKTKDSGQFNPILFALNKELTIPIVNKKLPFVDYETGKLRRGNGNPASDDYDSLADYQINEEEGVAEVRIPWLLLNITDPSKLEAWSDFYAGKEMEYEILDGIGLGMMLVENGQRAASLPATEVTRYRWESWDFPESKERLKESYYILQEKFGEGKQ